MSPQLEIYTEGFYEFFADTQNKKIESKCGWSPFDGDEFKGTPVATIIAGNIKMRNGEIIGEPDGTPLQFS